jgi:hypothetical protein
MKILGCPPTSPVASSSGSPGANSTESLPPGILTINYNGINIYVRPEDNKTIKEMINRIKNKNLIKDKNASSATNLTLITKKEPTEEQIINRMKVKYKLLLKERNEHLNKLKSEGKKPKWANNLASLENNFNDEYTENYVGSKELMKKLRKEAINELKSE